MCDIMKDIIDKANKLQSAILNDETDEAEREKATAQYLESLKKYVDDLREVGKSQGFSEMLPNKYYRWFKIEDYKNFDESTEKKFIENIEKKGWQVCRSTINNKPLLNTLFADESRGVCMFFEKDKPEEIL